jgi:hypothetical protein
MALLSYHSARRGFLGFLTYITGSDSVSRGGVIPAMTLVDSAGAEVPNGGSATPISVQQSQSATATATQVASNVAAVTLLAANTARKGATIFYDGGATLYLLEGAGTPSATNWTVKLGASSFLQYEAPPGFTGAIKGIWSSAVGSANVTERTA